MMMSYEERIMVLRDKAADIGVALPIEVADYLATRSDNPNDLKSSLINVASFARQRKRPISLQLAQFYLDGVRPEGGIEALPTKVTTRQLLGSLEDQVASGQPATIVEQSGVGQPLERPRPNTGRPVAPPAIPEDEALYATLELPLVTPDLVAEPEPEPAQAQLPIESSQPESPRADAGFSSFQSEVEWAPEPSEFDAEPPLLEDPPEFKFERPVAEPASEPEPEPEPMIWPRPVTRSIPTTPEPDSPQRAKRNEPLTERNEPPVPTLAQLAASMNPAPIPSPVPASAAVSAPAPAPAASVTPSSPAASVQFAPIRSERKRSMLDRIRTACKRAGIENVISAGDKVAIKVHFGEQGNTAFVSSIYTREVVRLVKELGGKPFVTDANTLYSGMRSNAIDHIQCALENGFAFATIGAPIIIADGLDGHDATEVHIEGKHFDTVKIGSAAVEADAMVVISHIKGHEAAGFGGALKNIGMGLGCRSAKQRMHSGVKPEVQSNKCTNCCKCINWCPQHCITTRTRSDGKRASWIDTERCIGCGECVAACAYGAIEINWASDPADFLERMVEHAAGTLANKHDKTIFLSFLTNISPDCDCFAMSDAPIVGDIGVLVARDAVAIDQAAYDLVAQAPGLPGSRGEDSAAGDDTFLSLHGVEGDHQMTYGEALGLGTRRYELKKVG